MLSCFSCVWLCDSMDCSLSGSSICGILQARIQEWFAIPSSRGSSWPRDRTVSLTSPELADGFFTTRTTGEALMTSLNIILSRSIYVVSKAKFLFFPELRSYLFKTLFRWRTEMKLLSNKKYELNCCFFLGGSLISTWPYGQCLLADAEHSPICKWASCVTCNIM